MVDTFQELIAIEEKESRTLQEVSARAAIAATSAPNAKVLGTAIKKAQQEVTQPSKVDTMRTDLEFMTFIDELHAAALEVAFKSFDTALVKGFTTSLEGRAELQTKAEGTLEVTVDVTKEDTDPLKEYPVLGHTILEISMSLADNLRFSVVSLSSAPLRGDFDLAQLPKNMENEQEKFARQVAQTVNTAYLSGTQAAQELIRGGLAHANTSQS